MLSAIHPPARSTDGHPGRLMALLKPGRFGGYCKIEVSVVVIVSPGAARHAKPAVSRHAIAQRSPLYWTVRPGDTFWQISEATKLTIGRLEAYNPNIDPRALIVGQRLNLTP